jgi:hypothetical protein
VKAKATNLSGAYNGNKLHNAAVEQTHDKLFASKAPQAIDNVIRVDPVKDHSLSHTL